MVVKVEGMEQEEDAVVAVAVGVGAGNNFSLFFFSIIFNLKGTLPYHKLHIRIPW